MRSFILFDFDGTIADTSEGITRAFDIAAAELGLRILAPEEKPGLIGPPIKGTFMRLYGLDDLESERAAELFREHYSQREQLLATRLYPGIKEALKEVVERGAVIGIATNKRTDCAVTILDEFGLHNLFGFVSGSEPGLFWTKTEIVARALDGLHASPEDTLLVGDTNTDYEAARENGLDFVAVTYGFGYMRDEVILEAIAVANEPRELVEICHKA